ncbi:MAG: response regulator [Spirochaetales bacterium]|nr:response regulator [Spirochaetales bacterium]
MKIFNKRKDQFSNIFNNSPFGYAYHKIILDKNRRPVDYKFLEVNYIFEYFTGLKREFLVGQRYSDIFPERKEGDFDWVKYYGHVALNNGNEIIEEFSANLNKWYKIQVFSPRKGYFVTIFVDITDEKAKNNELEGFFNVNLDLLCIADTSGNFVKVNREWENLLGYSVDELEQRRFLDFVHPDDIPATLEILAKLETQEDVLDFVNRYRCKDGSYKHIEWRSHPHGKLVYAAARDITQRIESEKVILAKTKYADSLLKAIPDLIFILDVNGKFMDYKPGADIALAFPESMFLGKNISDLFSKELSSRFMAAIRSVSKKHKPTIIQYELEVAGNTSTFEARINPFLDESVIALIRNISEMKKMQESLAKAKELAEAGNQAKSEFLANMSHEIRTPLNAIIGLSRLVLEGQLSFSQKDSVSKIYSSSKMLLGIINDILDYSKIEAGKLELDCHDFIFEEVLDQLKIIFPSEFDKKGIELCFELPTNLPYVFYGDSFRLYQVLTNLVGNALKFTETGSVRLGVFVVKESKKKVRFLFEVEDTGIGLTEEQSKRLFKAFSQADTSTTRKFGGSGLGLVISSKLLNAMASELKLDSVSGKGSRFYFELDLLISKQLTNVTDELEKMDLGDDKLALVVDDQKIARDVVRKILESWGVSVLEAESGEAAIKIIKKIGEDGGNLDFVFMDWKMPGKLDGISCIKKIRKMHKEGKLVLKELPIILISAYQMDSLAKSNVKVDGFLPKPVTASALHNSLGNAMSGNVLQRPELESLEIPSFEEYSILLVEDNHLNQEVASRWLEKTGANVLIANNGVEALAMVEAQTFDLILMDLQMPEMDGFEATRKIRAKDLDLPIIALSAAVMEDDRERAKKAGVNDHIAKPIDERVLYSTLAKWLKVVRFSNYVKKMNIQDASFLDATNLDSFDFSKGLYQADNDVGFYKHLLSTFKDQLKDEFSNIVAAIESNSKKAESQIHSLKGLAATVGAITLSQIATDINNLQKEKRYISVNLIKKLENGLKQTLDDLEKLDLSEIYAAPVDKGDWIDLSSRVLFNLKRSELVDRDSILKICSYLDKHYGRESTDKFKNLVDTFENDKAAKFLSELISSAGEK